MFCFVLSFMSLLFVPSYSAYLNTLQHLKNIVTVLMCSNMEDFSEEQLAV